MKPWIRCLVLSVVVASALPAASAAADPAGDAPAGLERFYHQDITWGPCHDDTLDAAGADCGTVTVPLDYSKPDGRTLTLALSRIAAADPAKRRGVLLTNPGGPGGRGLTMNAAIASRLSQDVRDKYDLIGMDPRGIGRSDSVHCAIPLPTMWFSSGFDTLGFARDGAVAGAWATSCVAPDPEKVRNITTRNTARDLDVLRGVFGEDKLDYYGVSYGTYLGAVYTQMFGDKAGRILLDSALDPNRYWLGMVQDWGPINEYALDDWAAWAARHDDQYHFGTTAPAVRAWVENLIRRAAAHPVASLSPINLIDEHTVPVMMFSQLANPQANGDLADILAVVDRAVDGQPVDMNELLKSTAGSARIEPGAEAAVMCGDRAAPRDPSWYLAQVDAARATQPVFGAFANDITACAFWPDPLEPTTEVHNDVPALILASDHDPRTAYWEGVAAHQELRGSVLVTLENTRIHGAFRPGLSPCVNDAANTYLSTGVLPSGDLTCQPEASFFPQ
ncbi:alpha/beta hydrolase [Nocardia stercoris]|nr:alpha/beta hydrolase [Nocardia stercoris]